MLTGSSIAASLSPLLVGIITAGGSSSSTSFLDANAFLVPPSPSPPPFRSTHHGLLKCATSFPPRYFTFLYNSLPGNNEDHLDDNQDGDNDSSEKDSLASEFQSIKKDRYGTDISPTLPQTDRDDLQTAASNAESSFLAAMLEQTSAFQQLKSQKGSDEAVEIFKGRIQQSDREGRRELANELEQELQQELVNNEGGGGGNNGVSEEVARERMEKKWFIQLVQREVDEEAATDNTGDVSADDVWQ